MLGPMLVPRPNASPGRPRLCPRPLAATLLLLAAVAWVPRPSSADGEGSPKFGTIATSSQYYELPPKVFPKQGAPGVLLRTGGNPPTAPPPKATTPSGNDTFIISLKTNTSSVENSTLSSALNYTLPPVLFPSIPTHPSSGVNSTPSDSLSTGPVSTLTAQPNTTTSTLTTSHASNLNSTSYAPNASLVTTYAPNTNPPSTATNLPNVTATPTPPTSLGKQPFIEPSRSAAILVGIFVSIAVIGYVGLMVWRRFLERKYGNREVLINEEDFDPSDLKHFEL